MTEAMSWKLVWEYRSGKVCTQRFLTEAEALAFVERTVDNDPKVESWVIMAIIGGDE
jgi:hypothetical protein